MSDPNEIAQVPADDPYKKLKPKDVLVDPGFYNLDRDTRSYILERVEPQWKSWNQQQRDAYVDAPIKHWEDYFAPPKQPNAWDKMKALPEAMGTNLPDTTQPPPKNNILERTGNAVKGLFNSEGKQEYDKSNYWLRGPNGPSTLPTEIGAAPAPDIEALAAAKTKPFRRPTLVPDVDPMTGLTKGLKPASWEDTQKNREAQLPRTPQDLSSRSIEVQMQGDALEQTAKRLETQRDELNTLKGPFRTQAEVDTAKAKVATYNKAIQQFQLDHASFVGQAGQLQRLSNMAATDVDLARIDQIGKKTAPDSFLDRVSRRAGFYAKGLVKGATLSQVKGEGIIEGQPANWVESAEQFIGEQTGVLPYYMLGGEAAQAVGKWLPKIPVVGKYLGILSEIPEAEGISSIASKITGGAMAKEAVVNAARPGLAKALEIVSKYPTLSKFVTAPAIRTAIGTAKIAPVMAGISAIQAIGNGTDPKQAALDSFATAMIAEGIIASPPVRAIVEKLRMSVRNPDIAKFIDAATNKSLTKEELENIRAKAGAKWDADYLEGPGRFTKGGPKRKEYIDAAIAYVRNGDANQQAETKAIREFLDSYLNRHVAEAIPEAAATATAYGLSAAGLSIAMTPGDIKTKLMAGGQAGLTTFLAVGAFRIPGVIDALSKRAGRPINGPTDAAGEWSKTPQAERETIVNGLPEGDLQAATDRTNTKVTNAPAEKPVKLPGVIALPATRETGKPAELPAELPPEPPGVIGPAATPAELAKPESLPGDIAKPAYAGEMFSHFTSKEAKTALESGAPFDFNMLPIHGTGDLGGGPKTGRFAGNRIYLSLDDKAWGTTSSREGADQIVDVTPRNMEELKQQGAETFYNYDEQKWQAKVGAAVKQIQLEPVRFRLDPTAKVVVVDSKQKMESLASEVGEQYYRDNPSFWDKVAEKYDAVVLKNVQKIADKTDDKFFRAAMADQIIVLNTDKASVVGKSVAPSKVTPQESIYEKATREKQEALRRGSQTYSQEDAIAAEEGLGKPFQDLTRKEIDDFLASRSTQKPLSTTGVFDSLQGRPDVIPQRKSMINMSIKRAKDHGIEDEIAQGLIDGKTPAEIATPELAARAGISESSIKQLASVIKTAKVIPPKREAAIPSELPSEPVPTSLAEPLSERPTLTPVDGKIKTRSGREIPMPPAIRLDTNRKATIDVKKVDAWLLDQARKEAGAREDMYVLGLFGSLSADQLSPADKDSLNQYLFGHEDPLIKPESETKPESMSTGLHGTPKSWKVEFLVEGKWSTNGIRFASKAEAKAYGNDKLLSWTMPTDVRAVQAEDEVNYRWDHDKSELVDIKRTVEPIPAELKPEPQKQTTTDRRQAFRDAIRKELGKKAEGIAQKTTRAAGGVSAAEIMKNSVILDNVANLGQEIYNTGTTDPAEWHTEMFRELEELAEGLGLIIEPLFPNTWEAVTGSEDYAGGTGGVYGSFNGMAEDSGGGAGREGLGGPATAGAGSATGSIPTGVGPDTRIPTELPPEPGTGGSTEGTNPEQPAGGTTDNSAAIAKLKSDIAMFERNRKEAINHREPTIADRWKRDIADAKEKIRQLEGKSPTPIPTGGRYSLRGKPPIVLTLGQRKAINAKVEALVAEKNVGDPLTEEEKDLLRQYTGLGHMTEGGRGILFEDYTSYRIVEWQWDKIRAMGFPLDDITMLDPAFGNGNYAGFAPASAKIIGTETNQTAAKAAQLLYPDAKIQAIGFEQLAPRRDIDLAMTNVPFYEGRTELKYADEAKAYGHIETLHDFFFMKSLDMTRPNGMVSFISSIGTMDGIGPKKVEMRKEINRKAEFLGAYRIPSNEFKANTQYDGTADIIFLRKRTPEEIESWTDAMYQPEFIESLPEDKSPSGAMLSRWYVNHPEKAWGNLKAGYGMQQNSRTGVEMFNNGKDPETGHFKWDTAKYDAARANALSDNVTYNPKPTNAAWSQDSEIADRVVLGEKPIDMPAGTIVYYDGQNRYGFASRDGNIYEAPELPSEGKTAERIKAGYDLMTLTDDLYAALRENDNEKADSLRKQIKPKLQVYRDQYATPKTNPLGLPKDDTTLWRYLNGGPATRPFPFADPRVWKLAGLTDKDGNLAEIFKKNTIYLPPPVPREFDSTDLVDTAKFVYEQTGGLDWAKVGALFTGTIDEGTRLADGLIGNPDFSIEAIGSDGVPAIQIDDEYLYGEIWPKIDDTIAMINQVTDPNFNSPSKDRIGPALGDQLNKLQSALMPQADIPEVISRSAPFSRYIPESIVKDWLTGRFPEIYYAEKLYDAIKGKHYWSVQARRSDNTTAWENDVTLPNGRTEKITLTVSDIDDYINHHRPTRSIDTGKVNRDGDPIYKDIPDERKEAAFNKLAEVFRSWALENQDRFVTVADDYNRHYRSVRDRAYADKPLAVTGLASDFKGDPLKVGNHQWQTIGRSAHLGSAIIAHDVGGGKTMSSIILEAYLKAYSGAGKALFVVPPKVIKNWAYEINQLFPDAKLIELSGMHAVNRNKMLQLVAAGDYDYVLMSQNEMTEIPLRKASDYLMEDYRKYEDRWKAATEGKNRKAAKDLEKKLARLAEKLAKMQDMKKTKTIFYEDLGIKRLYLDEGHAYKNAPMFFGDMSEYMRQDDWSDRAADMVYKTRHHHELRGGRKGKDIFMLTATPTPNSPIEIYTMMKYVAPDEWTSRGIMDAGDFLNQFGRIETIEIMQSTGVPTTQTKVVGYQNLRELRAIFHRWVDYRPTSQLDIKRPESEYSDTVLEPTEEVIEGCGYIASLWDYWKSDPASAMADKITPATITTRARQLSVDPAILDPLTYKNSFGKPGSKLDTVLQDVLKSDNGESTQLIFCDLYRGGYQALDKTETNEEASAVLSDESDAEREQSATHYVEVVNAHKWFKQKLMAAGIPESQIAIINSETNATPQAKFRIQQENAEGNIRFIIGTTGSMGEGMNLQVDTTYVHEVDMGWNPDAEKQRTGRAVRQGNKNETVRVKRYLVKGTYDAALFNIIGRKARWAREIYLGTEDQMVDFEEDGKNYDELATAASIQQTTLDYYINRRAITTFARKIAEIQKELDTKLLPKNERYRSDIEYRKNQVEHYQAIIDSGEGTDWHRRTLDSHQDHIAQLQAELVSVLSDINNARDEIKGYEDSSRTAQREVAVYEGAKAAGQTVEQYEQDHPDLAAPEWNMRVSYKDPQTAEPQTWTAIVTANNFVEATNKAKELFSGTFPEITAFQIDHPDVAENNPAEDIASDLDTGSAEKRSMSTGLHKKLGVVDNPDPAPPAEEDSAEKKSPIPVWPREVEPGPGYIMTVDIAPPDLKMLNNGFVPPTIADRFSDDAIAAIDPTTTVSKTARGWMIESGGRQFLLYTYEKGTLDIYEKDSQTRIETPEMMNVVDAMLGGLQGGNIKLNTRLRSTLGRFVYKGTDGKLELRPELFKPENREALARVMGHEIGHALDWLPDNTLSRGNLLGRLRSLKSFYQQTMKGILFKNSDLRKELVALSEYWDPYDVASAEPSHIQYRRSPRELYADFISVLLNSPGTARRMAPKFYREWHANLDNKPDVKEAYAKLTKQLQGGSEEAIQFRLEQARDMLGRSDVISVKAEMDKVNHRNTWWGAILDALDSSDWRIARKTLKEERRKGAVPVADETNPRFGFDELTLKIEIEKYKFLDRVEKEVHQAILVPANITAEDMRFGDVEQLTKDKFPYGPQVAIGLYRFLHRAATERSHIANPKVIGGRYADETLELLKMRIGDAKFAALEAASHKFDDIAWEITDEAFRLGNFPMSAREYFEANKYNYTKFVGQEYISDYVGAAIKHQIGFLGEIENPFISDLKRYITLIKMNAVQGARNDFINFWFERFNDDIKIEIEKAVPNNTEDKIWTYPDRSKEGLGLIHRMEDGKQVGYYVDRFLAHEINDSTANSLLELTGWMKAYHSLFYGSTILYNLGFGAFTNPIRDFAHNYAMLADTTIGPMDFVRMLNEYRKAFPEALHFMQGKDAPVVDSMISNYEWFVRLSKVMRLDGDVDPYHLQLEKIGLIQITGDLEPNMVQRFVGTALTEVASKTIDLARTQLLHRLEFVTDLGDLWGKVVAHNVYVGRGEYGKRLAWDVRNRGGTPPYYKKGFLTATTNFVFPFSNIALHGYLSVYGVATDPKTAGGFWWRSMKVMMLQLFLKLLFGGSFGLLAAIIGKGLAEDVQLAYSKITGYMKQNYMPIIVGYTSDGQPIFFAPPMSEEHRLLWGGVNSVVDTIQKEDPYRLEDFVKFVWGQIPSFHPIIKTLTAWGILYSGWGNPPDGRRGSGGILPEDSVKNRYSWGTVSKMLQYTLNQTGLTNFSTWDPKKKNLWQKFTQGTPLAGPLLGRVVRVGGTGDLEEQYRAREAKDRVQAQLRDKVKGLSPIMLDFQREKSNANINYESFEDGKSQGIPVDLLKKKYPKYSFASRLNRDSREISRLAKVIENTRTNPNIGQQDRDAKILILQGRIVDRAQRALDAIKGKEELPDELTSEPEALPDELTQPPAE